MSDVVFLDVEDLLRLTKRLNAGPVRDLGLLDAAAARPRSSAFGVDAYPTLALKAAALMHSIAGNHALVDGNKRLALLAAAVFLDRNGMSLEMSDDVVFELVMGIASGSADVEDIADRMIIAVRRRQ